MGHTEHSVTGYVTERSQELYDGRHGPEINLGLATSPIGPAPELQEPLARRDPLQELAVYPQDPLHVETRKLVLEGLGLHGLSHESLLFADNGSYGAGDEIVRYLALNGNREIIAPHYSFPNVAQWALRHDVQYTPIPAEDLNPLVSISRVLNLPRDRLAGRIVYLDYPNNPFGISDPELMRAVIAHAAESDAIPLLDLAFGEVLEDEFAEAIQYTVDHGGVCLGSLSKTQGCPGLRTGYTVLSPRFTDNGYSGAQRMVFGLNREAEFVYRHLFAAQPDGRSLARTHASRVAEYNRSTNAQLFDTLQAMNLRIGPTDMATPIQVVISDRPDFYNRLAANGVITESLSDYQITLNGNEGYGDSAVRMLTPGPGQLEDVLMRVSSALAY